MKEKTRQDKAVALTYKKESGGAPVVVASGKGAVAEKNPVNSSGSRR